jgi:hypothetical protein
MQYAQIKFESAGRGAGNLIISRDQIRILGDEISADS